MNQTELFPKPFLKWAGGKRSLLPEILPVIPDFVGTYYEPFLGAGSVFLALPNSNPKIGADTNGDLIATFEVVRDSVEELISELNVHVNSQEHFLKVRQWDREDDYADRSKIERAARFIFLNRTCYHGLHRVNSQGHFNVPFGHYKTPFSPQVEVLRGASQSLRSSHTASRATFRNQDFRDALKSPKIGDFVYIDPPYDPVSKTSNFVSYQLGGFSQADQTDLRDICVDLTNRGVGLVLSNSSTEFVHNLFRDEKYFSKRIVSVRRSLGASDVTKRQIDEVLVSNQVASDWLVQSREGRSF